MTTRAKNWILRPYLVSARWIEEESTILVADTFCVLISVIRLWIWEWVGCLVIWTREIAAWNNCNLIRDTVPVLLWWNASKRQRKTGFEGFKACFTLWIDWKEIWWVDVHMIILCLGKVSWWDLCRWKWTFGFKERRRIYSYQLAVTA